MSHGGGDARLRAWPFLLDKRYADAVLPDGSLLTIWLGRLVVFGIRLSRFTADFCGADGTARHARGARRSYRLVWLVGKGGWGPAVAERHEARGSTRLSWKSADLSGDLVYTPRHPPIDSAKPLLRVGARSLRWIVEVPDADVSGELRWEGGSARIEGRGYIDRVRLDLLPWRFPIGRVHWGHAVAGDRARIWLELEAEGEATAVDWIDGELAPPRTARPELGAERLLSSAAVVDSPALRLGALRPLIRRWFSDLRLERRLAATAIAGESGWAVHETACFR